MLLIAAVILAGCTQTKVEPAAPTPTQAQTPTVSKAVVSPVASMETEITIAPNQVSPTYKANYEYVWYEDDYVKFMYPKGWKTEIQEGKIILKDDSMSADVNYEGVRKIKIGDNFNGLEILDTVGTTMGEEGGFRYDSKLKKGYLIYSSREEVQIDTKPYERSIPKLGSTMYIFPKPVEIDVSYKNNIFIVHSKNNIDGIFNGFMNNYIWIEGEDVHGLNNILGGTGKVTEETVARVPETVRMNVNCAETDSEKKADQCAEFVNKFFDTAQRKK